MKYRKTLKIPVHYEATKTKMDKLDKLTARITYTIRLISDLITDETKLDRKTVRKVVRENNIVEKTGLSAGFVDQCVDKVIWAWKSYRELHKGWEKKVESAKKRSKNQYLKKLLKREPSPPNFEEKIPCRIDYRTGKVEPSDGAKLSPLWIHLSTLKKRELMDIPLNPCEYHLNQLKDAKINDFEIVKDRKKKKYYIHVSITKETEDKPMKSVGGIDQGLNHPIAIVLLSNPIPYESFIGDAEKEERLRKYDTLIGELQNAEKFGKLRSLRNKRQNISENYDWEIANRVADISQGYLLGVGDPDFRQTQYRGNGMPKLRKRIGKWSYSRQRSFIQLKRAEIGYPTIPIDERGTSKECYLCGSKFVKRKWLPSGESYILCYDCGLKKDSDISSAYLIAFRCKDELLKVQMNYMENIVSVQDGCPSIY